MNADHDNHYCRHCGVYHYGMCSLAAREAQRGAYAANQRRIAAEAEDNAASTVTNFDLPDFLAAQRQAANHNAEQRLREKARENEAFYRVYAPHLLRVDAAIDANTSDLRPVQRDYVSAAQRDQARLRTVDVV